MLIYVCGVCVCACNSSRPLYLDPNMIYHVVVETYEFEKRYLQRSEKNRVEFETSMLNLVGNVKGFLDIRY